MAGDNVIPIGNITRINLPTDGVLENSKAKVFDGGVVVLGWNEDGELYFASSIAATTTSRLCTSGVILPMMRITIGPVATRGGAALIRLNYLTEGNADDTR